MTANLSLHMSTRMSTHTGIPRIEGRAGRQRPETHLRHDEALDRTNIHRSPRRPAAQGLSDVYEHVAPPCGREYAACELRALIRDASN